MRPAAVPPGVAVALLLAALPAAHGHGLGVDTIPPFEAGGREISMSVEMPQSFDDGDLLTITATDAEAGGGAGDLLLEVAATHGGAEAFRGTFLADDGVLVMRTVPAETPAILGEPDPALGAYRGTHEAPVGVAGPAFADGGLYTFEIEVVGMGDPPAPVGGAGVHVADVSVAATSEHPQADSGGGEVAFRLKSYFDRAESFSYDPGTRTVTFEMPFDWSEGRMSHVPVVHEEVHFPKGFAEFLSPSYSGSANGVGLFKASVTVDDYTEEDERIVHFVLLQDHLRIIKNEMKKSGGELPGGIVFTLAASDEVSFPLTAHTRGEDYQVSLSWDPAVIEPGVDTNFVFTIRDGATGEPLRDSYYEFVILQGGEEIHRAAGTARVGGEFEKFAFDGDQTGPTVVRFEDIRGTGQETEFGIVVAPEFGAAALALAAGAAAAALAGRAGRGAILPRA